MTNLDEIIIGRRSVRLYNEELVEREKIDKIIQAGTWAPTACNKQEYGFIYIEDPSIIKKLSNLGTAHFVKKCKQVILVLYDNRIDNLEYRDDILSAGAVIQNMLLKAQELNISACWVCNLPSKKMLRKLFDIPKTLDPVSLITIGKSEKVPKTLKRKHSLEEIVFINKFDPSKFVFEERSSFKLLVKRLLRKIYIRLPKNKFLFKIVDRFEKKFDN